MYIGFQPQPQTSNTKRLPESLGVLAHKQDRELIITFHAFLTIC